MTASFFLCIICSAAGVAAMTNGHNGMAIVDFSLALMNLYTGKKKNEKEKINR
jgi:hypothetical protein